MVNVNFDLIVNSCPKAWEDFLKFYSSEFLSKKELKEIPFTDLPFELQLGIYLKYFNDNGVELDVCNTDFSILPSSIEEAFTTYEKVISHYS